MKIIWIKELGLMGEEVDIEVEIKIEDLSYLTKEELNRILKKNEESSKYEVCSIIKTIIDNK